MKLQKIKYYVYPRDKYIYTSPKLNVGDNIELLYNDESPIIFPDDRIMKRGNYVVVSIMPDPGSPAYNVYVFSKKCAPYDPDKYGLYHMCTIIVDKAIESGAILVENFLKKDVDSKPVLG